MTGSALSLKHLEYVFRRAVRRNKEEEDDDDACGLIMALIFFVLSGFDALSRGIVASAILGTKPAETRLEHAILLHGTLSTVTTIFSVISELIQIHTRWQARRARKQAAKGKEITLTSMFALEEMLSDEAEEEKEDKVLLMGKGGSGKTSMRSIIFGDHIVTDTARLEPTVDVERVHIKFLGNMVLHLWDCGGQEAFLETYLASQRKQVFRNVQVLIYVFDVESQEFENDCKYFERCLKALFQYSKYPKVFCLLHKMDLIEEDTDQIFGEKKREILRRAEEIAGPKMKEALFQCFPSSLWDETLYKAWAAIVNHLVPNSQKVSSRLRAFGNLMGASEVMLFERTTFLVIGHAKVIPHPDAHRFEKVSNIIKQFQRSCGDWRIAEECIHVRSSNFSAFLHAVTPNSFVLIIHADPNFPIETTTRHVRGASAIFENLEHPPRIPR